MTNIFVLGATTSGGVDWIAISAIAACIVAIPVIAGWVTKNVSRWWANRSAEESEEEALHTAVFGRPARPPYPAVLGALQRLESLESDVSDIKAAVLPNGGSSLADKISRIDNYLMKKMREEEGTL